MAIHAVRHGSRMVLKIISYFLETLTEMMSYLISTFEAKQKCKINYNMIRLAANNGDRKNGCEILSNERS